MSGRCMCGDPECGSCGRAQGTYPDHHWTAEFYAACDRTDADIMRRLTETRHSYARWARRQRLAFTGLTAEDLR